MKVRRRSPRLTRVEKLTKGLASNQKRNNARFTINEVDNKGRSLFLHKGVIKKDSYVLEYKGDLITHKEAVKREKAYASNNEGCYILFFRFQEKRMAIDATRSFGSYARYLNHSRNPNIKFHFPLIVDLDGTDTPRIAAYALRDIHEGEEIVFDYGVRNKDISWLKNTELSHMSEILDNSSTSGDESSLSDKDERDDDDDDDDGEDEENHKINLKEAKLVLQRCCSTQRKKDPSPSSLQHPSCSSSSSSSLASYKEDAAPKHSKPFQNGDFSIKHDNVTAAIMPSSASSAENMQQGNFCGFENVKIAEVKSMSQTPCTLWESDSSTTCTYPSSPVSCTPKVALVLSGDSVPRHFSPDVADRNPCGNPNKPVGLMSPCSLAKRFEQDAAVHSSSPTSIADNNCEKSKGYTSDIDIYDEDDDDGEIDDSPMVDQKDFKQHHDVPNNCEGKSKEDDDIELISSSSDCELIHDTLDRRKVRKKDGLKRIKLSKVVSNVKANAAAKSNVSIVDISSDDEDYVSSDISSKSKYANRGLSKSREKCKGISNSRDNCTDKYSNPSTSNISISTNPSLNIPSTTVSSRVTTTNSIPISSSTYPQSQMPKTAAIYSMSRSSTVPVNKTNITPLAHVDSTTKSASNFTIESSIIKMTRTLTDIGSKPPSSSHSMTRPSNTTATPPLGEPSSKSNVRMTPTIPATRASVSSFSKASVNSSQQSQSHTTNLSNSSSNFSSAKLKTSASSSSNFSSTSSSTAPPNSSSNASLNAKLKTPASSSSMSQTPFTSSSKTSSTTNLPPKESSNSKNPNISQNATTNSANDATTAAIYSHRRSALHQNPLPPSTHHHHHHHTQSQSSSAAPPVAVIKPFKPQDSSLELSEDEKMKLTLILGPHLFNTNANSKEIEDAIAKNWSFFKSLTDRGITINDIRASVRKFVKAVEMKNLNKKDESDECIVLD